MAKSGLSGLFKGMNEVTKAVNQATRVANTVQRAKNTSDRAKGTIAKEKEIKKSKKELEKEKKEAASTWLCTCGTSNISKFCGSCGKPNPCDIPCKNCGWKRTPDKINMKFCGECGTLFEETN